MGDLTRYALRAQIRPLHRHWSTQGMALDNPFSCGVLTPVVRSPQNKLELVTGIPVSNQVLSLYNAEEDKQPVATLEDDSKPLGYYGVRDWQFLKVCSHFILVHYASPMTAGVQISDTNPSATFTGQLTDVSQVEKFELSEEAYAQRNGNLTLTHFPRLYQTLPRRYGSRVQTTPKTWAVRGETRSRITQNRRGCEDPGRCQVPGRIH